MAVQDMSGKVCMITGANSGIGKAAALGLARLGATIVMVCRDRQRGEEAVSDIKGQSGNSSVELMICDLSSQGSIHRLAEEFKQRHQRLHVLVNNAGVILGKRSVTEDDIETTLAVNHLAYFLLTNLLLGVLRASAPSRIVNVSSEAHRRCTIDFDDLQGEGRYSDVIAYRQSKLANILFTHELARRLEATGITANSLHPGTVATKFGKSSGWRVHLWFTVMRPFLLTPEQGAETILYLASSADVEGISGKYFINKSSARPSEEAYDAIAARRLWDVSARLTSWVSE